MCGLKGRNIAIVTGIAMCLFVVTTICAISRTVVCVPANITMRAFAGKSRCILEGSGMCLPAYRAMCALEETFWCVFVGTNMCVVAGTTVYVLRLYLSWRRNRSKRNIGTHGFVNDIRKQVSIMYVLRGPTIVILAGICMCLFIGTTICAISGTSICFPKGKITCRSDEPIKCLSAGATMCAFKETFRCVLVWTSICGVAWATMYVITTLVKHGPSANVLNTSNAPAADRFKTMMQAEMRKRGLLVKEISLEFEDSKQQNLDLPLILVCNNCSRIITDIKSSLEMIEGITCGKIIFIVLHVGRKNTTPTIYTRQLQETTACFEKMNIDTIIDMAYNKEHGIYGCEMNKRAFEELSVVFKLNKIYFVIRYLMRITRLS